MKMSRWFLVAAAVAVSIVFAGCPNGANDDPTPPTPTPPAVEDPPLVLPFNPGPVNPQAVWTMSADTVIQGLDGQIAFPEGATHVLGDWLQMAGSAAGTAHAVTDETRVVGSTFLRRAGRTADWNTFDIRTTAQDNLANFVEGVPHVITVWGHTAPGTEIRFGQADAPHARWSGEVTAGEDGLFMLRRTFTWAEITTATQNRIRFLPDSTTDYEIFNMNVVPVVEDDGLVPDGDPLVLVPLGEGADGPLNIDSVLGLQDAGNPDLVRQGNYILVTGRAQSWYAIDTQFDELTGDDAIVDTAYYTLTVTGRMLAAGTVRIEFPLDAAPWNVLIDSAAVAANGEFTLVAEEVLGRHINGVGGVIPAINATAASANIRITGPADIDILITGITLQRLRAE